MKKTLIFASLLAIAVVPAFAVEQATTTTTEKTAVEAVAPKNIERKAPVNFEKKRAEFENRLKLTDEQKAKAKEIRQKGHEEMKPVMEKIKVKYDEIANIKRNKMAEHAQQEQIAEVQKQIKALKRHAHEIRMKNMKEFESILTKKQLKELKKMKEEGRKNFEKEFKKHHPQGGPGFRPFPPEAGVRGPRPFPPVETQPIKDVEK